MSTAFSRHFSTGEVAKQFRVAEGKVRGWITSHQLAAVNVAANVSCRPKWRIPQSAIDEFVARRQAKPAVKISRRRKRQKCPSLIEFF